MAYKVLIADDDPMLRGLLRVKLGQAGFDITEASNGEEALKLVQEVRPDLIVLDAMMPVMDGDETLRRLMALPFVNEFKVIMLSARRNSNGIDGALQQGAFEFLTKPFNPDELVETVNRALNGLGRLSASS